jgi:acyl-CoA thioesterase-2
VSRPAAVRDLLRALDLQRLDPDRFSGRTEGVSGGSRLFGGLIAAQSLRAAQHTVRPELAVHSLHCYFLREGRTGEPVDLQVDRIRSGRSFDTRQVIARQEDVPIFTVTASFQKFEQGPDWGRPTAPGVPDPDRARHHPTPWDDYVTRAAFDVVELSPLAEPATPDDPGRRAWVRTAAPVPDDPALHACLLAYVSDFATAYAALRVVGSDIGSMVATLDHSIWFHRPGRIDDWVYFDVQARNNSGNRGLVSGTVHSHDGAHLASLMQEALIRPRRSAPEPEAQATRS